MLRSVKNTAVICNIGHFDNEIDTQFMRDEWNWEEIKPQVHRAAYDQSIVEQDKHSADAT